MSDHGFDRRESGEALTDRVVIESPGTADGSALWKIARDSGKLDLNSSYAYLLWCRDFAETSVVARVGGDVVGFVTGYRRPDAPDTLLVWQVAVSAAQRGGGIAAAMLDRLLSRLVPDGVRFLETTVTADNVPSDRMFRSLARRWQAASVRTELFAARHFPDDHDAELLYRIGPLEPAGVYAFGR